MSPRITTRMSTRTMREITPFKDAEEIKQSIPIPLSLWQRGCDDAKAGRPPAHSKFGGGYTGYTQGYEYGASIVSPLPEIHLTEPGVYVFPCGGKVAIRRQ